uniref:Uncharacterized protein LOC100376693 n=1 Tax=Saccoglossus kowalevskii TaxID=10224 RepID=A0ABM0GZJ5_SACKO|nr:PREDICTED: uncharacterized protein LOC100376693 [Saccoglossus kowalevskii]
MDKYIVVLAVLTIITILNNGVDGKSVLKREDDSVADPDLTILPLQDIINSMNATTSSKRQLAISPDTTIGYVLFATCTHIAFWTIDFTDIFEGGQMFIKVYTDPNLIPNDWTAISQNMFFRFMGHPTFTITIGPYDPCTTVTIITELVKIGEKKKLGSFSVETDCPCKSGNGHGDPHYTTFQQKSITFDGPCSYILTDTCQEAEHSLKLVVKHESVSASVRRIESANVYADGHVVNLMSNGDISVDGQLCTGTTCMIDDLTVGSSTFSQRTKIIFSLTGKWWIEWSSNPKTHRNSLDVDINSDSILIGKMCGLLGPKYPPSESHAFKGYELPDGRVTMDSDVLGNSWVQEGSCEG